MATTASALDYDLGEFTPHIAPIDFYRRLFKVDPKSFALVFAKNDSTREKITIKVPLKRGFEAVLIDQVTALRHIGFHDVYVCPNAGTYRKDMQITRANAFFVDIDSDGTLAPNVVEASFLHSLKRANIPMPHAIVRTGNKGGLHAYWFTDVDVDIRNVEQRDQSAAWVYRDLWTETQRKLVRRINTFAPSGKGWYADPACVDLPRLLRAPGSLRNGHFVSALKCGAKTQKVIFEPFCRTIGASRTLDDFIKARDRRLSYIASGKHLTKAKVRPIAKAVKPVAIDLFSEPAPRAAQATTKKKDNVIRMSQYINLRRHNERVCAHIAHELVNNASATHYTVLLHLYAAHHLLISHDAAATQEATLTLARRVGYSDSRCVQSLSTTLKAGYRYRLETLNKKLETAQVSILVSRRDLRRKHDSAEARHAAWVANALDTANKKTAKTQGRITDALRINVDASLHEIAQRAQKTVRHMRNLASFIALARMNAGQTLMRKLASSEDTRRLVGFSSVLNEGLKLLDQLQIALDLDDQIPDPPQTQ